MRLAMMHNGPLELWPCYHNPCIKLWPLLGSFSQLLLCTIHHQQIWLRMYHLQYNIRDIETQGVMRNTGSHESFFKEVST